MELRNFDPTALLAHHPYVTSLVPRKIDMERHVSVTSLIPHNKHISYHTTTTSHISHITHRHLPIQFPDIGHHANSTSNTHHTHNTRIPSHITHISRHTSFTSPTFHITCHFQRPDFNSQRSSLSAHIHQIAFDLTLVLRLHTCRQPI